MQKVHGLSGCSAVVCHMAGQIRCLVCVWFVYGFRMAYVMTSVPAQQRQHLHSCGLGRQLSRFDLRAQGGQ